MLFAACMSLSSFVLQFGHSNILSFNSNSTFDPQCLQYLVVGKAKNTKFYNNTIQICTDRDINKRNIAKKNKLNYLVFYSILEIEKWIKDGKDK